LISFRLGGVTLIFGSAGIGGRVGAEAEEEGVMVEAYREDREDRGWGDW